MTGVKKKSTHNVVRDPNFMAVVYVPDFNFTELSNSMVFVNGLAQNNNRHFMVCKDANNKGILVFAVPVPTMESIEVVCYVSSK